MKIISQEEAKLINAVTLAFVGDAVHTLWVRQHLAIEHTSKSGELHKMASKIVCANNQCQYAEALFERLTQDEQLVFLRGRNAKTNSLPKNATVNDYHKATAFEAVLGYLYLSGQQQRLEEILGFIGSVKPNV